MSEMMNRNTLAPPSLQRLLTDYLKRLGITQALEGKCWTNVESEVEPYHSGEVNVLEPRTALEEALAAAHWLLPEPAERSQFQPRHMRDMPEWAILLRRIEPVAFLPMALGYFPQLVSEVQTLWQTDWQNWKPPARSISCTGVWEWGELMLMRRRLAESLFAAAVLRLLGQTHESRQLLRTIKSQAPSSWHLLLTNEEAALAWQEGDFSGALSILRLAQDAPPICFNRGLCALLLGETRSAREMLAEAASLLPNSSPWHHLAQLYRLLIE